MTPSVQNDAQAAGEHLDGLLERALAGRLSETEQAQLLEHTRSCAACAALLELGPALARRTAPVEIDAERAAERDRRLVARMLSAGVRPARTRRARLVVSLAAAALLLGSFAAAQYAGVLPSLSSGRGPSPGPEPGPATQPRPAPRIESVQPAAVTSASPTPLETKATAAVPTAEAGESAGALFSQANQLKRSGQDAPAIALYRKLQQTFPRSNEAALSHATLGSLLLQRGDARGALAELDRYIAHGGPVLEEALAGRARALGQLGQQQAETRAWQQLLERFPSSVHAARARARLGELR